MSSSPNSYLIVAISNAGGAPEQAYRKLQAAGACSERPFAELFKFEVPSLMVGTLDTLMNLSDELGKTDALVEGIVRKIEKTVVELGLESHGHGVQLTVGGVPAHRYVQQFAWDAAKYPNRRPLRELTSLITGGAAAIEEELKQLSQSFADKVTALADVKRRKTQGNLLSADLNDVLTPEIMSRVQDNLVDSQYLKTVFVAVPKVLCESFEEGVASRQLGQDIVGYGGPDWTSNPTQLGEPFCFGGSHHSNSSAGGSNDRHKVRGSPVVPGTLQKVHADEDSVLYAVTVLKEQYEAGYYDENGVFQAGTRIDLIDEFTKVCRDKRFIVRSEFVWDPTQANKQNMLLEQLQVEVDGMKSALARWCKNHYGDAFVAWMHIQVIRVFVEAVLRYGLPVDFTTVLYKVRPNRDVQLLDALDSHLGTGSANVPDDDDDDDMGAEEYHDFVLLKFEP